MITSSAIAINNSNLLTLPVAIPHTELNKFCQQHCITKLSLFSSVLRDDFTDN